MATKKKMLQAAAGNATGGEALNVEDVFSTYLYEGNGSTQTITNGIDLDGEGGLVWVKNRSVTFSNILTDTERGIKNTLESDTTVAQYAYDFMLNAFNSDGFQVGAANGLNASGEDYASWTFRKAPKFFDVVTYTGDGVAGRTVSHSLGANVGTLIVKKTNSTDNWFVWHRGLTDATYRIMLNSTSAETQQTNAWNSTAPSSTEFTLGDNGNTNASGDTYVAYLFAHNDGDGEFGPNGDQDIIKCGSYTGNGSTDGVTVDLGFEPQWLLFKDTTNSNDWIIIDNMRGMVVDNDLANADAYLRPNLSNQEGMSTIVEPTATGFKVQNNGWTDTSGANIIYMAIRRGPLAQPESGTEVFAVDTRGATNPSFDSTSSVVDFSLMRANVTSSGNWITTSRLTSPKALETNSTDAEAVSSVSYDWMNGVSYLTGTNANFYSWMWKRAPGFCDVVAYTGDGVAGRTVSHNLGVAPEMMWVKSRSTSYSWAVYHKDIGATKYLNLSATDAAATRVFNWNDTEPTASDFTVGAGYEVNRSSFAYIAYLFATLDGVSKVGSYTGNGTSQTIDCGFTSGARFVLIKSSDSIGNWNLFDTTRGIAVGNSKLLRLNNTSAEVSGIDWVEPDNSGFIVNGATVNGSSAEYIFYAIA